MCHIGGAILEPVINWFRGLSRTVQIIIIGALIVFTPVVSIAFSILFGGISAAFSIVGFMFNILNWKGVLFFLVIGIFFAAKAGYNFIENYEVEDTYSEDDTSWDPFR